MESKEFEALSARITGIHAALSATTLVLCAATSLLKKAQLEELLARVAKDSAEKQASVEQQQNPQERALVRYLQAAEERLFLTVRQEWKAHNPPA